MTVLELKCITFPPKHMPPNYPVKDLATTGRLQIGITNTEGWKKRDAASQRES